MQRALWGLLLSAPLALSGCFNLEEPICTFACGTNGSCPDDYECRSDNFCHKKGTTGACGFSDAAMPADAGADLGMPDLAAPDLGMPDLAMPDLSNLDLTPASLD